MANKPPPNSAQRQQLQMQRIGINYCVNHPVGAPQFAAVSILSGDDDEDNNNKHKNRNTKSEQQQTQFPSSIFAALPHDRGSWMAVAVNTNNNNSKETTKVQCFSTWASPESYKNFFTLSANNADEYSDDDDGDSDDDDDAVAGENKNDDDDDDDAVAIDDDKVDDDYEENSKAQQNATSKKKKRQKIVRRPKHHNAFRRLPDKLPEAWFVLSESGDSSSSSTEKSFDMLPLQEVFTFTAQKSTGVERHNQREDGKAPELFVMPGTRIRRRD